jgi:hypothetical protein
MGDHVARLKKAGEDFAQEVDLQSSRVSIGDQWQKPVCPLGSLHLHLLYRWRKVLGSWPKPHLDEPHGHIQSVVDLRVPHALA